MGVCVVCAGSFDPAVCVEVCMCLSSLLRMSACCLSVGILVWIFGSMASCVSVVSEYLLLRPRMSFQSLEGFYLCVVSLRSCLNLLCCSVLISSSISAVSSLILLEVSGVGGLAAKVFALVEFLSYGAGVNGFVVFYVARRYEAFVSVCYCGLKIL